MDKEIIVMPLGGVSRLAVKFKVTRKTVYEALSGKSNSALARMLRKAALEGEGEKYALIEK